MPEPFTMSTAIMRQSAMDLNEAINAHMVYLEGYPYTGFAVLHLDGTLELPPPFRNETLNWNLFWDVRVFSEIGDWHAWRLSDGKWQARSKKPADFEYQRLRHFILAGNKPDKEPVDGWVGCSEASGVVVWLPARVVEQGHPVCLKIVEHVEPDRDTGLAEVVDAVFTGFEPLEGHRNG